LGLYDTSVTAISNSDRVKGCYYKESASGANSKLYFNDDITGPIAVDDTDRSSICAVVHTETTSEALTTQESTISETTELETTPFETTKEATVETTSEVSTTQESTVSETTEMETTPFETTEEETTSEVSTTPLETTEEATFQTTSEALTTQESTISETTTPSETTEVIVSETTSGILTTAESSTTSETTEESTISETMEPTVAPGFSLSSVGRCRLLSQLVITEHHCAQGAIELGLSDVTVQTIEKDDRPYGCYFKEDAKDGKLWLNIESETLNFDADESRQSICFGDGAVESFASKLSMVSILVVQVSFFLFLL